MLEIETERLILREWRESDLDPYARMCSDLEVMRYLPGVLDREGSEEQITGFVRHWEERGFGLWVVEHKEGQGGVYRVRRPAPSGELARGRAQDRGRMAPRSLLLETGPRHRGRARELALRVRGSGAGRHHQHNAASRRVMEKAGLTFRGETRWKGYGVVWYAIDREEWAGKALPGP